MKIVSVKIPGELLNEIDLYAMNHRISRSELIRNAIEFFLNEKPSKE